jgi:N-acetylglucosamine-6-sulfatase
MNNLLRPSTGPAQNTKYFGRPAAQLFARLDTLLLVLKDCKQEACRNPYSVLFPAGQVSDLTQAMHSKYDAFFAQQPQVSFAGCIPGHIVELEGPQDAFVYTSKGVVSRRRAVGLSAGSLFLRLL